MNEEEKQQPQTANPETQEFESQDLNKIIGIKKREIKLIQKENEELKTQLHFLKTQPILKQEFLKAGGLENNFDDWMLKFKESINLEPENFKQFIKESQKTTAWAFEKKEEVNLTENLNLKEIKSPSKIKEEQEYIPGTLYKKQNY